MSEARCYFCEGIVDEQDGGMCSCGTAVHYKCLDRKGLVAEKGGGLLSSSSTYGKCPECGQEHKL